MHFIYIQGLDFLNLVVDIWTRRHVSDVNHKAQLHSECLKWLLLLLQLIDVTVPQADTHLRQFIRGKGIVRVFKKEIEKAVSLGFIYMYVISALTLQSSIQYHIGGCYYPKPFFKPANPAVFPTLWCFSNMARHIFGRIPSAVQSPKRCENY